MAVRLSALRIGRALLPRNNYLSASGTHFCKRLSKPQGLVRPEGLGKLESIHSPHRVSNPRRFGLQHSALNTTLQREVNHAAHNGTEVRTK
jgi:hypothetical protein